MRTLKIPFTFMGKEYHDTASLEAALLADWDMASAVLRRGDFTEYFEALAKADSKQAGEWRRLSKVSRTLYEAIWKDVYHEDCAFANFIQELNPEEDTVPEIPIDDWHIKRISRGERAKKILSAIEKAGEDMPYADYCGGAKAKAYNENAYIQHMALEELNASFFGGISDGKFSRDSDNKFTAGVSLAYFLSFAEKIEHLKKLWTEESASQNYFYDGKYYDSYEDFKQDVVKTFKGKTVGERLCKVYEAINSPQWVSLAKKDKNGKSDLEALQEAFKSYSEKAGFFSSSKTEQFQECNKLFFHSKRNTIGTLIDMKGKLAKEKYTSNSYSASYHAQLGKIPEDFSVLDSRCMRLLLNMNEFEAGKEKTFKVFVEESVKDIIEIEKYSDNLFIATEHLMQVVMARLGRDVLRTTDNYTELVTYIDAEKKIRQDLKTEDALFKACAEAYGNGTLRELWQKEKKARRQIVFLLLSPLYGTNWNSYTTIPKKQLYSGTSDAIAYDYRLKEEVSTLLEKAINSDVMTADEIWSNLVMQILYSAGYSNSEKIKAGYFIINASTYKGTIQLLDMVSGLSRLSRRAKEEINALVSDEYNRNLSSVNNLLESVEKKLQLLESDIAKVKIKDYDHNSEKDSVELGNTVHVGRNPEKIEKAMKEFPTLKETSEYLEAKRNYETAKSKLESLYADKKTWFSKQKDAMVSFKRFTYTDGRYGVCTAYIKKNEELLAFEAELEKMLDHTPIKDDAIKIALENCKSCAEAYIESMCVVDRRIDELHREEKRKAQEQERMRREQEKKRKKRWQNFLAGIFSGIILFAFFLLGPIGIRYEAIWWLPRLMPISATATYAEVHAPLIGNALFSLSPILEFVEIADNVKVDNIYVPFSDIGVDHVDSSSGSGNYNETLQYINTSDVDLKVSGGILSELFSEILKQDKIYSSVDIQNCENLDSVEFSEKAIYESVSIQHCPNVSSIEMLDTTKHIFITYCESLPSVEILGNTQHLFIANCETLSSIKFPEEKDVQDITISTCPNLSILDTTGGKNIEAADIRWCDNLSSILFSDVAESVSFQIEDCENLSSIKFEENINGSIIIMDCPNLSAIEFAEGMASGSITIQNCPNLKLDKSMIGEDVELNLH